MIPKGIRIRDKNESFIEVKLRDILTQIIDGEKFYWSILFSEVMPLPSQGAFTTSIEQSADNSETGHILTWQELNTFTEAIHQELDLRVVGALDLSVLKKYDQDAELLKNCDVLIEMFDSSYWEVFSKDHSLIDRLANAFNDTEFLTPDWSAK